MTMNLLPWGRAMMSVMISSAERASMGRPQEGQYMRPRRAKKTRKKSWISVTVPTVERGLREVLCCSSEMAGERPSIFSTSGLSIWGRNCRA